MTKVLTTFSAFPGLFFFFLNKTSQQMTAMHYKHKHEVNFSCPLPCNSILG